MTYVEGLQSALAAEHAAVYVVGALGAQTSRSAAPALHADLQRAYEAHRARRDLLTATIRDQGADPVAAEPAYRLPAELGDAAVVTRRARQVQHAVAAAYGFLVAHSPSEQRRWAIRAMTEAAVRALAFRGTPETFPGSDEHTDR